MSDATDAALLEAIAARLDYFNRVGPWGEDMQPIVDALPRLLALARDGLLWRQQRAVIHEDQERRRNDVPGAEA